ncbi:MAG: hypothetical protein ABR505_02470, partial [Actinomycetota bacterium]
VDRHYELHREYLFVPHQRKGSVFRDSACSRTTRFRTELTRFRPSGAEEPSATPSPESPSPDLDQHDVGTPWLPLGATLVASALIGLVLLRRR